MTRRNWADIEREAEVLARRARRAASGAVAAEMVAHAKGREFKDDGGSYDWTTAGGRAPSIGPMGTGINADEQQVFEFDARRYLCREGDPCLVANVAVRLASGQIDVSGNDISDVFMRVRYGSDNHGPLSVADFDLIDGVSVPILGRLANFSVVYPKMGTLQIPVEQPLLDISISIGVGDGQSGGTRGARRTIKVGDVGNGQTGPAAGPLPIPNFAVSAVYASNDTTTGATLQQTLSPINGSTVIALSVMSKVVEQSVAIIPGARGFSVNASQAALTRPVVVFLLDMA